MKLTLHAQMGVVNTKVSNMFRTKLRRISIKISWILTSSTCTLWTNTKCTWTWTSRTCISWTWTWTSRTCISWTWTWTSRTWTSWTWTSWTWTSWTWTSWTWTSWTWTSWTWTLRTRNSWTRNSWIRSSLSYPRFRRVKWEKEEILTTVVVLSEARFFFSESKKKIFFHFFECSNKRVFVEDALYRVYQAMLFNLWVAQFWVTFVLSNIDHVCKYQIYWVYDKTFNLAFTLDIYEVYLIDICVFLPKT